MNEFIELPNGEHKKLYKDHEKWTSRRWAWEFLRRNTNFQDRCKELDSLADKKKKSIETRIANEFGLKDFKDYREVYGEDSRAGKPQFLQISTWFKLENAEKRMLNIGFNEGQVVIRFNLLPALKDEKALKMQIAQAEEKLRRRFDTIVAAKSATPKSRRNSENKVDGHDKLYFLRLLDAKREKIDSQPEIYKLLNGDAAGNLDRDQIMSKFKSDVMTANELAESRYIMLAIQHDSIKKRKVTR